MILVSRIVYMTGPSFWEHLSYAAAHIPIAGVGIFAAWVRTKVKL